MIFTTIAPASHTPDRNRRPRTADGSTEPAEPEREMPAATRVLEDDFRRALGTKVQVSRSREGGKVIVYFYSEEELEALYEKLVGHR